MKSADQFIFGMMIPLKLLQVEDSEDDALLIRYHLKKAGYNLTFERVETAGAMRAALKAQAWDFIIADYNLPQFNAPDALAVLKESGLDIPFVVVSGAIGEETAVNLMRTGAQDYLMKDKLARLGPVVQRELDEARVRAEKRRSEERYFRLANNAPDVIFRFEIFPTHRLEYINPAIQTISGYTPQECYADPRILLKMVHPEDPLQITGVPDVLDIDHPIINRWITKDGGIRWVESRVVTVHDAAGVAVAIEGIVRDITDRKLAEAALLESEERFRSIAEQTKDVVFITDAAGIIVYLSPVSEQFFGYELPEMIGKPFINLLSPDYIEIAFGAFMNDVDKKKDRKSLELKMKRKDGSTFYGELNSAFYRVRDFSGAAGTIRDITERVEAARALNEKVDELERFNRLTVDRELRMIELKKEINALLKKAGQPEKYRIAEELE